MFIKRIDVGINPYDNAVGNTYCHFGVFLATYIWLGKG